MLVDGRGVPLGVAVDGANVFDQKLVAATLDGIPVKRPKPTPQAPQHLCLEGATRERPSIARFATEATNHTSLAKPRINPAQHPRKRVV